MAKFWQSKIRVWNQTGAGAIAETLAPGMRFEIVSVRLTLDAAAAAVENFTMTLNANAGAVYDMNFITQAMATVRYVEDGPDVPSGWTFEILDEVNFAYANTNNRTWGLTVYYRKTV